MLTHPLLRWASNPHRRVVPGLQANFTASPLTGYFPLTVTFTDATSGAPTNYAWDFYGDGGAADSILQNPTYIYTSAGSFTPQLTIYDTGYGTINVCARSNYIIVCASPTAPQGSFSYTPTSGSYPLTVTFVASASGPIAQIYWDVNNDGSYEDFGSTTSYVFTEASTYVPRMVLVGTEGFDTVVTNGNIVITSAPFSPSTSAVSWQPWKNRL